MAAGELRNVLQSPAVSREQKLKLARFDCPAYWRNQMAAEFSGRADQSRAHWQYRRPAGTVSSGSWTSAWVSPTQRVRSVRELTSAEKKKSLELQLAEITGKTVRATYLQDSRPAWVEFLVRVGSTIYDGSVHGRLQAHAAGTGKRVTN